MSAQSLQAYNISFANGGHFAIVSEEVAIERMPIPVLITHGSRISYHLFTRPSTIAQTAVVYLPPDWMFLGLFEATLMRRASICGEYYRNHIEVEGLIVVHVKVGSCPVTLRCKNTKTIVGLEMTRNG